MSGSRKYVTTYCNKAHWTDSGRPYMHECRVIPPRALRAEIQGDFEQAIEIMNAADPNILRGIKGVPDKNLSAVPTCLARNFTTGTVLISSSWKASRTVIEIRAREVLLQGGSHKYRVKSLPADVQVLQ